MDNEETTQGTQNKSASGVVLVLLLCAVVAGGLYLGRGRISHTQEQPQTVASVVHLEPFTVNLSDPAQKAYLRLGVDLELGRAGKPGKGDLPVSLVRDTILTVLMATTPAELVTPAGKQNLKEQLLQSLQKRAPELGIREIFFTDFLIQQ